MTEDNLKHFFNNVTSKLNIHGWTLRLIKDSSDGYCWHHNKTIDVGLKLEYPNIRQLILHEIAHINTCRFSNQKHTPLFWKSFEDLLRRFLRTILDEDQLNHKKYTSEGIHSLIYQRKPTS